MEHPVRTRFVNLWPYLGITYGLTVSVWANVTSAAADADPGDRGRAMFLAASAPIGLFVALETLTRTEWAQDGRGAVFARRAFILVAATAAVVSYLHLQDLTADYGPDGWRGLVASLIQPLFVDGLMAVSAAALLYREKTQGTEVAPDPEPGAQDAESSDSAPAAPTAEAPAPARNVNGRDLRVTETVGLIRAARAKGEPDPTPNAIATHFGTKSWKTGNTLRSKALAEIGGKQ